MDEGEGGLGGVPVRMERERMSVAQRWWLPWVRGLDGLGVGLLGSSVCGAASADGRGGTVMHVVSSLETGGLQRQFVTLARRRRDWRFVCWGDRPGPFDDEIRGAGLEVERVYAAVRENPLAHALAYLFPHSTALTLLSRRFRKERPGCVWGWDFLANIVVAPAARLARVSRVVLRVENLSVWKTWPPHRRWWNRWADRNAARLADVVVVNAPPLVKDYASWARVNPEKIVVIPNGVDGAGWLARPWRNRRAELGIGGDEVVVLAVGRLAREKNHLLLLRASARLHREGVPHRLVVVGDGPLAAALRAEAVALGIAASTHWAGTTSAPQDFYRSADIFALSSDIEGLPNALLEAQVFGLPAITTAAGGAGWVVREGETGLVVPVGDVEAFAAALGRLVRDDQLRRRLGAAAANHVAAQFSWERWLARLEAVTEGERSATRGSE